MKLAVFLSAALLLTGCAKNIDTQEAVKAGVIKDVAKRADVGNMEVNVDSVAFRGTEADARVSFRPKGAPASQSMTMNYVMERKDDEWHIKKRNMEGSGHEGVAAGQGQMPAGHPPAGAMPPLPQPPTATPQAK